MSKHYRLGILGLLLALLALPCLALTTVTATLVGGDASVQTKGTRAHFQLVYCGANQPRVTGVAVLPPMSFDVYPDAAGHISKAIYGNDLITCGVTTGNTRWRVTFYSNNVAGASADYNITGSTFDLTAATPITVAPVVTAPTGDDTYLRLDAGNESLLNDVFRDSIVNGEVNASLFTGYADVCAFMSAQPAGTAFFLPAGDYTCTNTIALIYKMSLRAPAGPLQTHITYTGSGKAVSTTGNNSIDGLSVTLGSSATDGFYLTGSEVELSRFRVDGGGSTTNAVHIAAVNGSTQSGIIRLSEGTGWNLAGNGLVIDHVVDVFGSKLDFYASATSPGVGLTIDTGSSGINLADVGFQMFQGGGLVVKRSTSGAGAYNASPVFIHITNGIFDCAANACPSTDGAVFDSTLGTNPLYATFEQSWFSGYGHNGARLSGGQGIAFTSGSKFRSNYLSGLLADNANVANVLVADSFITGNNVSNNSDAHGVYVNQDVDGVSLSGNTIGNVVDTTGHQKYGVKFSAFASDHAAILGNDLSSNETGSYLYSATGSKNIWANAPTGTSNFAESATLGQITVTGQITAGSGALAITTADGHLDSTKLTAYPILHKQVFTSSGTFTIPTGTTSATAFKFTVVAGGGGGGSGTTSGGAGGGGAGGTARKILSSLTAGNTITVTIGAAGAAGAASNAAPGGDGGNSSIASGTETISTVTANGGGGGNYGSTAAVGGPGGTTSGGDPDSATGGDGDSAVTGVAATGGTGGASSFGGGGTGGRTGTGSNGRAFGSGGGGGSGDSVLGGTGAAGIVVVEWVL